MDEEFDISAPETASTGDFLSFTIMDGRRERPARITGTALALLGNSDDPREVFLANFKRIRQAAFNISKKHPSVDLVILSADSFR